MINAILNIIAFIIAIAVAILVIVSIIRNDGRGGRCDFNCEDCPFPKCSEAEIRRMKNDIHNR